MPEHTLLNGFHSRGPSVPAGSLASDVQTDITDVLSRAKSSAARTGQSHGCRDQWVRAAVPVLLQLRAGDFRMDGL